MEHSNWVFAFSSHEDEDDGDDILGTKDRCQQFILLLQQLTRGGGVGWLLKNDKPKYDSSSVLHPKKIDAPVTPKSASLELVAAKKFFDEEIL